MAKGQTYRNPQELQQLQGAVQLHLAGDYAGAQRIYESVLRINPRNPDALHLYGLAEHQQGRHASAATWIEKAIHSNDGVANFHNNLGEALRALGEIEPARKCYERALAIDARHADALNNLGLVLRERGDVHGAIDCFGRALEANPGHLPACGNLGTALHETGRADEALPLLRKAAAGPDGGKLLESLANALRDAGHLDEALSVYGRALSERPGHPSLLAQEALALARLGRRDDARDTVRRALMQAPDAVSLLNNASMVLRETDALDEAEAYLRKALAISPDYVQARRNLGSVLQDMGRHGEAIAEFERVVAERPDDAEAHFRLAFALLLSGDFEAGWREYEWRLRGHGVALPGPEWRGEDMAGRDLCLCAEQAAGDNLQFARYAALLAERGARVHVLCRKPLASLLAMAPGVERVLEDASQAPPGALWCWIMSVPLRLGTTLETIPAAVPYLRADPARVEEWRRRIAGDGAQLRVGIGWTGSRLHVNNRRRSCPLQAFRDLGLPGVALYSLQKDSGVDSEELEQAGVRDPTAELRDYADTAALIEALDLVVTVDTSIAHLAGALAKPVWILLPHAPDWRWLTGREDSPWYPTARLFRQAAPGEWPGAMRRVAAVLGELLKGGGGGAVAAPSAEPAAAPPAAPPIPVGGPYVLRACRHGPMLFNPNDRFVGRSLELYGEFSELEQVFLQRFVGAGDTVVEVGANIGAHTVALAKAVGAGGRVIAYEPQRLQFQLLCANLALNGVWNVQARPSAAGVSAGTIRVPLLDPRLIDNFGGVQLGEGDETVAVETLDALALERCVLIKVDVEGMELAVLQGARETIARLRPLLYVENDRRERSAALIGHLQGLGYRLWWHLPPLFNPDNHARRAEDVFPGIVSVNMFCAPRERAVEPGLLAVAGPDHFPLAEPPG